MEKLRQIWFTIRNSLPKRRQKHKEGSVRSFFFENENKLMIQVVYYMKNNKYTKRQLIKIRKMKRGITIAGILFVLLIAGSGCHRFERRQMRGYAGMHMNMNQNFGHHRWMSGMREHMFQGRQFGMRRGFGMMGGMDQGMRSPMMRHGMMGNMGRMPGDSTGWMQMATGRRILESIPNVTDSQKKQIEDLIKNQQDDMKKLREDMSAKMKDMMASHRKDMLNILTADQKKFIEDRQGRTENVKK
jgi:hypothetical protein